MRYLVGCPFLRGRPKTYSFYPRISGVTGPIFIKFAQYVANTLPLNIFNRHSHVLIRLGTPTCRNHFDNVAQNWSPWQRPLGIGKRGPVDHLETNTHHFVEKNRENRSSRC